LKIFFPDSFSAAVSGNHRLINRYFQRFVAHGVEHPLSGDLRAFPRPPDGRRIPGNGHRYGASGGIEQALGIFCALERLPGSDCPVNRPPFIPQPALYDFQQCGANVYPAQFPEARFPTAFFHNGGCAFVLVDGQSIMDQFTALLPCGNLVGWFSDFYHCRRAPGIKPHYPPHSRQKERFSDLQGNPITPADDEWINTRERLIKARMTNGRYNLYPINWQIAEHLIIDELCSRENVAVEHIEFKKERN